MPFLFILIAVQLQIFATPVAAQEAKRDERGQRVRFSAGANLSGIAMQPGDTDELELGTGLSVSGGIRISDRLGLHVRYNRADVGHAALSGSYQLHQLDFGGRFLPHTRGRIHPYVEAVVAVQVGVLDRAGLTPRPDSSGLGGGAGFGVAFHPRRWWSLEAGLDLQSVSISRGRVESGEWVSLGSDRIGTRSARTHLGVTLHR